MKKTKDYINSNRHEFDSDHLIDLNLSPENPFQLFEEWLAEAIEKEPEPYAFYLSTADGEGRPSGRILYLRDYVNEDLVFFTNYESQKGKELLENPQASIVFFWPSLHKQVRVEGTIKKVSADVSDKYFNSRPRANQIGAWASSQSKKLDSRDDLLKRISELEKNFEGKKIDRPVHWGGYQLIASKYEFWLGQPSRLHDRLCYELDDSIWTKYKLNP